MSVKPAGIFVLLLVTTLLCPVWAAQEVVPGYAFRPLTVPDVEAFLGSISREQTVLEKALLEKYGAKREKVTQHPDMIAYGRIVSECKRLLDDLSSGRKGPEQETAFMRLQRIHYSALADQEAGDQISRMKRRIAMGTNIVAGYLLLKVPDVILPEQKIGEKAARRESQRLFAEGGKSPVSVSDLAGMNSLEVSRLRVAPDHPAVIDGPPGEHYAAFLDETTRLIRMQSPALAKFDSQYARRVLFFDELTEDATSPKVTAKDRYGLKWKVKWGDEVHTDVALTRLYIDLGGRYTDLKFYSGPGETILVLDPPAKKGGKGGQESGKGGKDGIQTFAELSKRLLESKFQFHADRYLLPDPVLKSKTGKILGSGIVDKAMADRESIDPSHIGSFYVLFKECQLSLYNPAIKRLGGTSLGNVGAEADRVARSSLIFNCWIKNKDMKDDNSRLGLLFNPETGAFDRTVEYQSDLGCTMGSFRSSGELNSFEKSAVILMPQSINFRMRPLYIPKAWKECTWADARWMALRIAKLSRQDIERCFLDCGWPPFAQKVAVERLLARRNEIAKAFKLDRDGIGPIPCDPDFDVDGAGKWKGDRPVRNGKICENSSIVRELEESLHPEGLANVISRKND